VKVQVVSIFTDNFREMAELVSPISEKYCGTHGFNYRLVEVYPTQEKPASWHKIPCMKEAFSSGNDWVVSVDIDAFFYNHAVSLHEFLDTDKDIVISKDDNGYNCGVMAWRNCRDNIDTLDKMWSMDEYNHHGWWEQAAFHHLTNENWNGINDRISEVQHNRFNSWEHDLSRDSLVFHACGGDKIERIKKILLTTNH